MGPVAVFAAASLLILSPVMRGGNRQIALLVLEAAALAFIVSLWAGKLSSAQHAQTSRPRTIGRTLLLGVLVLSPAWLALVYLSPLPATLWGTLPGRDLYPRLMADAGIPLGSWAPLSLVPDATQSSLLAGIPVVAGLLAGLLCRLPQLRLLLGVVVAMAFVQTLLALFQVAGGPQSDLYFGMAAGRPAGTFANPNHFANYLALALAAYVWLAWSSLRAPSRRQEGNPRSLFAMRDSLALWIAGGMLLVLGILISRSRGAALTGIPAAMLAVALVWSARAELRGWRWKAALLGGVLAGAIAIVGADSVLARFDADQFASSAEFRGLLASTTLHGAAAYWPWGAGWGSYAEVYPRFQPGAIAGFADYAHHDYAQMLFEGGIFAVLLAGAFLWLAGSRALRLVRSAVRHRSLNPDEMAAAVCGLGLLGFLLHSLAEFNMHIPANAIAAALLAGAYLRPLDRSEPADD